MIELHNIDCMELMRRYPDDYFDLSIVDPPYGIKQHKFSMYRKGKSDKGWDRRPPSKKYFDELSRVSKKRIIWGGNYFVDYLKNSRCWLVWNKKKRGQLFVGLQLAYTNFDSSVRMFSRSHIEDYNQGIESIHPTQKPIALYRWLLENYAKQGDKILDTHLGSGSSAIAAYQLGYDFVGCELDKDYFEAMERRVKQAMKQTNLFQSAEVKQAEQLQIF
mgnify:FL=1